MSAIRWQSWSKISLADSLKLLDLFKKHGQVIQYSQTRRPLLGPAGKGIVAFKESDAAEKLLAEHKSIPSETISDIPKRRVEFNILEKTPTFMNIEHQLHTRRSTKKRENDTINTFLNAMEQQVPGISTSTSVAKEIDDLKYIIAKVRSRKVHRDETRQ